MSLKFQLDLQAPNAPNHHGKDLRRSGRWRIRSEVGKVPLLVEINLKGSLPPWRNKDESMKEHSTMEESAQHF